MGGNAYGDVYDDEHEHLALNLTFIFLWLFIAFLAGEVLMLSPFERIKDGI